MEMKIFIILLYLLINSTVYSQTNSVETLFYNEDELNIIKENEKEGCFTKEELMYLNLKLSANTKMMLATKNIYTPNGQPKKTEIFKNYFEPDIELIELNNFNNEHHRQEIIDNMNDSIHKYYSKIRKGFSPSYRYGIDNTVDFDEQYRFTQYASAETYIKMKNFMGQEFCYYIYKNDIVLADDSINKKKYLKNGYEIYSVLGPVNYLEIENYSEGSPISSYNYPSHNKLRKYLNYNTTYQLLPINNEIHKISGSSVSGRNAWLGYIAYNKNTKDIKFISGNFLLSKDVHQVFNLDFNSLKDTSWKNYLQYKINFLLTKKIFYDSTSLKYYYPIEISHCSEMFERNDESEHYIFFALIFNIDAHWLNFSQRSSVCVILVNKKNPSIVKFYQINRGIISPHSFDDSGWLPDDFPIDNLPFDVK